MLGSLWFLGRSLASLVASWIAILLYLRLLAVTAPKVDDIGPIGDGIKDLRTATDQLNEFVDDYKAKEPQVTAQKVRKQADEVEKLLVALLYELGVLRHGLAKAENKQSAP
jgi:hypothetical protein